MTPPLLNLKPSQMKAISTATNPWGVLDVGGRGSRKPLYTPVPAPPRSQKPSRPRFQPAGEVPAGPKNSPRTSLTQSGDRGRKFPGQETHLGPGQTFVPFTLPEGMTPPQGIPTNQFGQALLRRDDYGIFSPQDNDLRLQAEGEAPDVNRSVEYADWYFYVYQPMRKAGYTMGSIPPVDSEMSRQLLTVGGFLPDGGPLSAQLASYPQEGGEGGGSEDDFWMQLASLLNPTEAPPLEEEAPAGAGGGFAISPTYFNPYLDY